MGPSALVCHTSICCLVKVGRRTHKGGLAAAEDSRQKSVLLSVQLNSDQDHWHVSQRSRPRVPCPQSNCSFKEVAHMCGTEHINPLKSCSGILIWLHYLPLLNIPLFQRSALSDASPGQWCLGSQLPSIK